MVRLLKFSHAIFAFCLVFRVTCNETAKIDGGKTVQQEAQNDSLMANITEPHWVLPFQMRVIDDFITKLENEECAQQSVELIAAIRRRENWALRILDSVPKLPTSLLSGNYYQLGNFDECVTSVQPMEEKPIRGHYCLADIDVVKFKNPEGESRVSRSSKTQKVRSGSRHNFNGTIHWAVCLPSACGPKDAEVFLRAVFDDLNEYLSVDIHVPPNKCYFEHPMPITKGEIIYGCIMGAFLVLTVLATAYHLCFLSKTKAYDLGSQQKEENSLVSDVVKCFSVWHNMGKWLTTKKNEQNIECISGLKTLSMIFIIVGHSLLFIMGGPVLNTDFSIESLQKVYNAVYVNNTILVDIFLFISGFLLSFLLLIELEKRKGKINFGILYIARYIRLTPSYLVVLGFYLTFFPRVGEGPLWQSKVVYEQERCMNSWWANLLYVNNYVAVDSLCMFQSWFLAVDFHLFIIAPFIIYALWKCQKLGIWILSVMFAATVAITSYFTFTERLDPTLMIYAPELEDISSNDFFKNAYIKTHMRAGSYFIGILFGHIVNRLQTTGTKISKRIVWIGWTVCSLCGALSLFSIVIFYNPDYEYEVFETTVYASLHRLGWCIFIGWTITACVTGNAEILNKILSSKLFVILCRLMYCAYLCNGGIVLYHSGTLRQPTYMNAFDLFTFSAGTVVVTFLGAIVLCILFESPIHGLEKILLRREKKS